MAAMMLELYSDFQCPACKALHEQTIKPLITDYVDKGKVYLIHREFPLPIHQYAREAACYVCAAGRLGKYDQAADALFSQQDSWSKTGNIELALSTILTPAEAKRVKVLAKSPEILADIEKDTQKGRDAKLQQTPTMIFSHKGKTFPVAGIVSYPILRRFIDQQLAS